MSDGVIIPVRVTSRSSRDAIEGPDAEGLLRVRVSAAPVDGAANAALVKMIASAVGVPKSSVTVVAGPSSRNKRLRIDGASDATVRARWPGIALGGEMRR
jgi:uncharacterized protein (TIGR00251 family)